MTELFIDGVSVVLPKDFSAQVKRENSFVTKNGEYTYDITLPLTNPINAELYKNIDRLNNLQRLETKRSAVLIADNRVYCNGTEVITGWTDDAVSLQIASGNSELNYFIGSGLQISFLNMKETIPIGGNLNYVTKLYPEVEYCLAPVVSQSSGHYVNKWGVRISGSVYSLESDDSYWFPLPYLCTYIKELLRALGYELIVNQLENSVFKDICICPEKETCKWNEMLPGWSVKDFLEEVEKLFNVVFVLDNRSRTVRLMMSTSYYTGMKSVHVLNVEDVYEVEVEEEPEQDTHAAANVQYKFPDTAYFRWRCLSENIINSAKKDTIPAEYTAPANSTRIRTWFTDVTHQKTDTIYRDLKDGRQYLYEKNLPGWANEPVYRMLNEFAPLERDEANVTIELEMMPVGMEVADVYLLRTNTREQFKLWLPTSGTSNSSSSEEESSATLAEKIENNEQQAEDSKGNIYLAFYTGLADVRLYSHNFLYPLLYTDEYRSNVYDTAIIPRYTLTNSVGASLRLETLDRLLYQGGYDIDYARAVKVRSHDPNVYSAQQVFEIRNKRYICKDMEFTLDANGRKGPWTGTFYPIHISDTEADARWILTDGKWRDGGVWLDNGRWLDG